MLASVDRKTSYTLLEKTKVILASEVNKKTAKSIRRSNLPYSSITNDNGPEFGKFGKFWDLEKELKAPVYSTHPLCPWERGSVENTIGLLRQYIPKGSDLTKLTGKHLRELEYEINSRPRKSLGYKTPIEVVTGKKQRFIKQKRLEPLPFEYYEQFYLTAKEIKEKNSD